MLGSSLVSVGWALPEGDPLGTEDGTPLVVGETELPTDGS